MAKKINYEVIDQMFSAVLSAKHVKRTAEKLEKAHPDSESIKYGFTIALMG